MKQALEESEKEAKLLLLFVPTHLIKVAWQLSGAEN